MVLREKHIHGSSGFIRSTDLMPLSEGFSAVIVKQVGNAYPHRIRVENLYEDLEFAEARVGQLMRHLVCTDVPLACLAGRIYYGTIYQDSPGVLAIHPDTIKHVWEGREDPDSGALSWQEIPVVVSVPLSPWRAAEREARRHQPQ